MKEEICEHVASGQAEPFMHLVQEGTSEKQTFCHPCLIKDLRSKGLDPFKFVIGYNFYQSSDPNLPKDQWKKLNDRPLSASEAASGFKQDKGELEEGVVYYSYVTAVSAWGIESAPSEVNSITIPPEE